MSGVQDLAAACRCNDEQLFVPMLNALGVETDALVHVAWQRGLRAYMLLSDHPAVDRMDAGEPFEVDLDPREHAVVIWMASAWIDGLAAHWRLSQSEV